MLMSKCLNDWALFTRTKGIVAGALAKSVWPMSRTGHT